MAEIDHELLAGNAGRSEGEVPGELSTEVPIPHRRNISSIRSFLLEQYKTTGVKHKFRKAGQDVIGYYSGHKLQILAGVGIAVLATGGVGGFVVYRQRRRK